jgi:hypothetical protein
MTENPYEAPLTFDNPVAEPGDAETVRREHLKTEASVKSIGILYYLGGIAILLMAFRYLTTAGTKEAIPLASYGIAGLLLALGIFQFIAGAAVRKFKPWSRIAVGILSGVGLIKFPVGTLINGYILFLVFGKKGRMVFSAPYQDIIAATPHVKYKTSKWVWIILGTILALVAIGIIALTMRG